jgi:hypothetical protein
LISWTTESVISDIGVFDDEENNREDSDEDEWICSRCWLFAEDGEIGSCYCSPVDYDVLIW